MDTQFTIAKRAKFVACSSRHDTNWNYKKVISVFTLLSKAASYDSKEHLMRSKLAFRPTLNQRSRLENQSAPMSDSVDRDWVFTTSNTRRRFNNLHSTRTSQLQNRAGSRNACSVNPRELHINRTTTYTRPAARGPAWRTFRARELHPHAQRVSSVTAYFRHVENSTTTAFLQIGSLVHAIEHFLSVLRARTCISK